MSVASCRCHRHRRCISGRACSSSAGEGGATMGCTARESLHRSTAACPSRNQGLRSLRRRLEPSEQHEGIHQTSTRPLVSLPGLHLRNMGACQAPVPCHPSPCQQGPPTTLSAPSAVVNMFRTLCRVAVACTPPFMTKHNASTHAHHHPPSSSPRDTTRATAPALLVCGRTSHDGK